MIFIIKLENTRRGFWKVSRVELILYIVIFILTAITSPFIIVWTIFGMMAQENYYIFPVVGLVLVVLMLQGIPLVYLNIKKSKVFARVNQQHMFVNFLKFQAKTLLIQIGINVSVFGSIVIYMYNS